MLEADYFGLEYQEQGSTTRVIKYTPQSNSKIYQCIHSIQYWLDLEKPLNRQVGLSLIDPTFRFCVKFYAADPSQLEEEFTRFVYNPSNPYT